MELLKRYVNEGGITKKRYSRSVYGKLQILSSSISAVACILTLFFSEHMTGAMRIGVLALVLIAGLILLINVFVLKIDPNDEMSRINYCKATESAFIAMSTLGCVFLIICVFFGEKLFVGISSYQISMGILSAMFLGFVAREVYFLKFERAEG